jgi:formylglycine-generating enzyme required for sulfatase activity
VSAICVRAQQALIACDVSSDLRAHIASCAVCDRVSRLSELLITRSRGDARISIAASFTAGQELLGYRLDAVIGEGGQGVVFKAMELGVPDSVVALKIVHCGGSGVDDSVKEVSFAKRINHANVCRVHHTAIHGAFRVIEMEHLPGGTLASRLAEGPPTRELAVRLFRGVLAGMEAVHRRGILHLDLKPLNILLRDDGEPVVTDFGMAMRSGSETVGGTSGWTAPEVERGEAADDRADIYSLGALLAALFPRRSRALEAVVARATAASAGDRYANIEALREAFEKAASGRPSVGRRAALVLTTTLVLIALLVAVAARHRGPRPPARASHAAEDMALVPEGVFDMGSPEGVGAGDEHPVHRVRVASFHMDRTEVTVAAYDACMADGHCAPASGIELSAFCNEGHADRADHPINCVTHRQAEAFCRWRGKRLPTEEEWEYAARGTDGRAFPWGNEAPAGRLCWNRYRSLEGTCAVASFPNGDSPFGLHDMAGNVWEWTSSGYSLDYSRERDAAVRVNRGGCWYDVDPAYVRSEHRDKNGLEERSDYLGFRCARD